MRLKNLSSKLSNLPVSVALIVIGWSGVLFCTPSLNAAEEQPPAPPREFRAAWVATVANIDWPSKPGLSTKQQKQELIAVIEKAAALNLNAIVFQVRPHCDAIYSSELEPWSEYLTGTMGKAPDPAYDPLELAVEEAHARGLELHAWFNPYRASHPSAKSPWAANHVSHTQPDMVRVYGKHLWLDPAEPAAADHSLNVILDVVKRYDVDGVHFDDYFYPYSIKDPNKKDVPFPDANRWALAKADNPNLDRSDWRRQQVDDFVRRVSEGVHRTKPWVKFGISPFGIWRPGNPKSVKGFDAYDKLYADAKKWLQQGWVDYLTPQLYWEIESKGQSYPALLAWWHEQNTMSRHLWPGNYSSRVKNKSQGNWDSQEILDQIKVTRVQTGAEGNVHFSMKSLMDGRGLGEALVSGPYSQSALVPATPWLEGDAPTKPQATISGSQLHLKLDGDSSPWLWVVQNKTSDIWHTTIIPGQMEEYSLSKLKYSVPPEELWITAVNRLGKTSAAQKLQLSKQ